MIRALTIAALALFATACDREMSAAEKAASDARDVARVEAAQDMAPPVKAVEPEPITFADLERSGVARASCAFLPEDGAGSRVLAAMSDAAYLKLDGELRVYAADKGSPPLPFGSWTRYEGREHVVDLQSTGGDGTRSGEETNGWPGRLTVRDPYDRVVYSAAGILRCGA